MFVVLALRITNSVLKQIIIQNLVTSYQQTYLLLNQSIKVGAKTLAIVEVIFCNSRENIWCRLLSLVLKSVYCNLMCWFNGDLNN